VNEALPTPIRESSRTSTLAGTAAHEGLMAGDQESLVGIKQAYHQLGVELMRTTHDLGKEVE